MGTEEEEEEEDDGQTERTGRQRRQNEKTDLEGGIIGRQEKVR